MGLREFLRVGDVGASPAVETLSSSEEDGYSHDLVHLTTDDDVLPALLAVPTGEGPFPAVVIFHQHAGQRHLGKSEVFGLAGDRYQAFGPALARAGFVVLAPDSIAFEDRRPGGPGTDQRGDDWDQHYNALAHRLVAGDTLMRKVLVDAMSAVSALVAMPSVDSSRITAMGHSYGGNTTLFLTAVDDRVNRGCASGSLASYRRRIEDGTGIEMAQVIPGLTRTYDLEHVLAAAAPRPFLIVSAVNDKYSIDADEIIDAARASAYAEHADALRHLRFPGGHALDQERFDAITDWIAQR